MRNVNLAHGSLYLSAPMSASASPNQRGTGSSGSSPLPRRAGCRAVMQVFVFRAWRVGAAPDPGDDRHLDRCRRPDARGMVGKTYHSLPDCSTARSPRRSCSASARTARRARPIVLPLVVLAAAIVIASGSGWCSPHTDRHDGSGGRRRPCHARGGRRQRSCRSRHRLCDRRGACRFAGVVGGTALSIAPGEDSAISCLAGGGDRRGMGSIPAPRSGAPHWPRRADRARLLPDLRHVLTSSSWSPCWPSAEGIMGQPA